MDSSSVPYSSLREQAAGASKGLVCNPALRLWVWGARCPVSGAWGGRKHSSRQRGPFSGVRGRKDWLLGKPCLGPWMRGPEGTHPDRQGLLSSCPSRRGLHPSRLQCRQSPKGGDRTAVRREGESFTSSRRSWGGALRRLAARASRRWGIALLARFHSQRPGTTRSRRPGVIGPGAEECGDARR